MAIWWPSSGSSCRVDLLIATYQQIYNAVRCKSPNLSPRDAEEYALDLLERAQGLRLFSLLVGGTASAIDQVTDKATAVIRNELPDTINTVTNFLEKAGLDATTALRRDLAASSAATQSIFDKIVGGVGNTIGDAAETLGSLFGKVQTGLGGVLTTAQSTLGAVVNNVRAGVGDVISDAGEFIGGIVTTARNAVTGVVTQAASFLQGAIANVSAGIGSFIDVAGGTIGAIATSVKGLIDRLIGDAARGIGGLVEIVNSIPVALAGVADDVITAVGGAVDDVVSGLGKFLSDPLTGVIGGFFHGEEPRLLSFVDRVYDRILESDAAPGDLKEMVVNAKQGGAPVPAIIAAVVAPFVIIAGLSTVLAPYLQKMQQEININERPTLFGLGDAVQAFYRGALNDDQFRTQAKRGGYPDHLIDAALALGRQLPTPTDLADWRHRGFISDGAMVERLQKQGWDAGDATHLLDASEIIPPVGDLVRFAVREAFPGQTGFSGARGSNVPSRFTELAQQQGLQPEFARSYWAAHWELPSVTSAFAMYHRGIIDEGDLRALLKEADFAPEWVDRIIAVAFDPLTRVDVRRMFALGVLDKSQVERAYRDLGYNARNARLLADFVEADTDDARNVETAAERDLTRGDLVGAYADGILIRSQALSALRDLGYSTDESELILDREDIRAMRAERKETKTAIVDQAVADVITFEQAQDKLLEAGYSTDEVTAAMREIERKLAAQIKQPTKAELDRLRKFLLLTDEEYRQELRRLGYADKWVEKFVALGSRVEAESGGN